MRVLVAVLALSQCPICWNFWYSQVWPFFKTMWANVHDMCWASEAILGGNCLFERVGHQQWCIHHASWISISWILAVKTDIMYVQILCNCGPFCEHGEDVGCQLIDIALRVELVRRDTVKTSQDLQVKWTCCHQMRAVQYTARYSLCSSMGGCGGCGGTLELVGTVLQPDTRLLPVGMSSPSSHCLRSFCYLQLIATTASV
jgi:hypothetical protein